MNLDGTTDGRATPNSCEHPKVKVASSSTDDLSLRPDGTLTEIWETCRPIENITTEGRCCNFMGSVANHDCALEHKTVVAMADGHPDAVTGKCTMLSAAQRLKGVPAFVIQ